MKNNISIQELPWFAAFVVLLALTLLMFGDLLFTSGNAVISREGTDLSRQFIYWRDFGFGQLKHGNLPLWNPYVFSGAPFLGGFQSALLYPPNLVYLILPLAKAINADVALHVFLIGFFTYLWSSFHGLHPLARLLSSILVMFSGAHFLHIYAGHLPNLCAMAWTPLLLLAVDVLLRKPGLPPFLLGSFALAMQILAGHPQYVYYAMLTIVLYAGPRLTSSRDRLLALGCIAGIIAGAVCLAAYQIAGGIDASRESIRSTGVSAQFAAMFSLPPENLVTLFAPYFFGDMSNVPYWGRGYLWEMCPFIGVTGLTLAAYGAQRGSRTLRLPCAIAACALMVLALGAHTPLFSIMRGWVPGYAFFRGTAKFAFFSILFFAVLAGSGLDSLLRTRQPHKILPAVTAAAGLLGAVGGAFLLFQAAHPPLAASWREFMELIAASRESYIPSQTITNIVFASEAASFAGKSLLLASATSLLLSLLMMRSSSLRGAYLISLLAFIEVFGFAASARPSFDLSPAMEGNLAAFYAAHPGDYRVLQTDNPNAALSLRVPDIWGYDPGIPLRYARFIAFTQGYDPGEATQYVTFRSYHPLYRMLRCRFVIVPRGSGMMVYEMTDTLPHLLLIKKWQLIRDYRLILAYMAGADFDPRHTVVLEAPPDPMPGPSAEQGSCQVVNSSTDEITIRADLPEPAILLITDSYSPGWRVRDLRSGAPRQYRIMPANYALMALPLAAGTHHVRLEYKPAAASAGKWISLISAIAYMSLLILYISGKGKKGVNSEAANHKKH